jgi:hypothetical protein
MPRMSCSADQGWRKLASLSSTPESSFRPSVGGSFFDAPGEFAAPLQLGDLLAHLAPRPAQEHRDFLDRVFSLTLLARSKKSTSDHSLPTFQVRPIVTREGVSSLIGVYASDIDVWGTVKPAAWVRSCAGIRSP